MQHATSSTIIPRGTILGVVTFRNFAKREKFPRAEIFHARHLASSVIFEIVSDNRKTRNFVKKVSRMTEVKRRRGGRGGAGGGGCFITLEDELRHETG